MDRLSGSHEKGGQLWTSRPHSGTREDQEGPVSGPASASRWDKPWSWPRLSPGDAQVPCGEGEATGMEP